MDSAPPRIGFSDAGFSFIATSPEQFWHVANHFKEFKMWSFYARIDQATKTFLTTGVQMNSVTSKFDEIRMLGRRPGDGYDIDVPTRTWRFGASSGDMEASRKKLIHVGDLASVDLLDAHRSELLYTLERKGFKHVLDCPIEELNEAGYANFSRHDTQPEQTHNGGQVVLVGQTINNYLTHQLLHLVDAELYSDHLVGLEPSDIWAACHSKMNWCDDAVSYDEFSSFVRCSFMERGKERLGTVDEALAAYCTNFYTKPWGIGHRDYSFEQNAICPVW